MKSTEKEDAMSVTMCSSQWNLRLNAIKTSWTLLLSAAGRVKRRINDMFTVNLFFDIVAILGIIVISAFFAVGIVAVVIVSAMLIHIYKAYKKEKNDDGQTR